MTKGALQFFFESDWMILGMSTSEKTLNKAKQANNKSWILCQIVLLICTYIHYALTLLAPTYPSALTFSSSRPQNSIWLWWRPPLNRRLYGTMTLAWPWTGIPILAPLRHNPMCNDGGKYVESTCLTYIIYCIDKHKYYAIA